MALQQLQGVNDDWWSQIKYVHNAGIDLSGGDRGISVKVKGPRTSVLTIQDRNWRNSTCCNSKLYDCRCVANTSV